MSGPIKDFSTLKLLRQKLKAQEATRQADETKQRRQKQETIQDANLFHRSIGEVTLLAPSNKVVLALPQPLPIVRPHFTNEQTACQEFLSDEFNAETLLHIDDSLGFTRNGIGSDVLRKLQRGHWVIQSQLDLHGMHRDQARTALTEFLHNAIKHGQRCVRVIHGKGLGSINKEPILKNKVRSWLVQKDEVLAFCQARAVNGGTGALVILLKA